MRRTLTDEYLKQFVEENSKCKFLGSFKKDSSNGAARLFLKLQCGEDGCGKVFDIQWSSFSQPTSCRMCPECTDKIRRISKRKNHAAKNNALEKCPDIVKVWDYEKNECGPECYSAGSTTKVWFRCDKEDCGHVWKTSVSSVVRSILGGNNGCKKCMVKYKGYDEERFVAELHDLHPHIHLESAFDGLSRPALFYCDVCDNRWTTTAGSLLGYGKKKPTGCAVCSRKTIGPAPKYMNSIWADDFFRQEWAIYFDEEFMKTHTVQSNEYVDIVCPDCGKIKHTKICNLYHRGFCCSCNPRSSYPNRFMCSILRQLGVDFYIEYQRKWTDGRRYDVYVKNLSLIIENHGIQHYEECPLTNRALAEEQANDAYKYQLAINHGIKHYVVLDCRHSEIEWIRNSIMNSELPQLLNFTEDDIDWNKAEVDALKNLVKEVCEEWEKDQSHDYSIVGDKFNISKYTVQDYLVIGAKHGWCSYNPNWWERSVYCFQFDKEWSRASDASRETGVCNSDILYCCKKVLGYAGIHPETGEELIWCFPEEKDTYVPRENKSRRAVVCIETMEEYRAIAEAGRVKGISAKTIQSACKNIHNTAGGYHWAYAEEVTEEKIEYAKTHKARVKSHIIYCVDTNSIYTSADQIRFNLNDWHIIDYLYGRRDAAGKSGYSYYFLYDQSDDDGTIIPGAISLGLITEEEALRQLNNS